MPTGPVYLRSNPLKCRALQLTCLLFTLWASPGIAQDIELCADRAYNELCPILPVDIPEFSASFIYRFIAEEAQKPFDRFSWQAFLAVNWPMDDSGLPLSQGYARPDDGTLLWESFATQAAVVEPARANASCTNVESTLTLSHFRQATGEVLMDNTGNYILYETRLNPAIHEYILAQGLTTAADRAIRARQDIPVEFPLQSDQGPGAQLLKFAWKILTEHDDPSHYLVRSAQVDVAPEDAWDDQPHCIKVKAGLVGLHLVQRVLSGHGDRWIWSTFEHALNAPLAENARGPNSIISMQLFPQGCLAPESDRGEYSFYHHLSGQPINVHEVTRAVWHAQPPHARNASTGNPVPSAKLVRCWKIFEGRSSDCHTLTREHSLQE